MRPLGPISLCIAITLSVFLFARPGEAIGFHGINMTKHNLSVSGPGPIKALTETRICIFCHTPHNAQPRTPLWNRAATPMTYVLYSSTTMVAQPSEPTGPSRLCLGCHDGTIALGSVLNPSGGISMTEQKITSGSSLINNLNSDHPISFSYYAASGDPQIIMPPPVNLTLYGQSFIECSTCHDPHDDAYGKFLVMDNRASALCVECHNMQGWLASDHRTSTAKVSVPLPGLEWTNWQTVADYGCESCHVMHNAGGSQRLLRFQQEENNCYDCHNGSVAAKNIYAQFQKSSIHPVAFTTGVHQPNEPPEAITDSHVECVDCHNPHAVNSSPATLPGGVSGMTRDVSGMDRNRTGVIPAVYEYQICFKCHADLNQKIPFIPRVINNTNMQADFDQSNLSYHPVEGPLNDMQVQSLLSPWAYNSIIKCTDCHADDDGVSNGPHGSRYAPILRDEYDMTIPTTESQQSYALCYRCHDENKLMANGSFKQHSGAGGHSGHVRDNSIPCAVCHDPHGIADTTGGTGSHTYLINFDTNYVSAYSGNSAPIFTDNGGHSGSCALVCHMPSGDVTHDGVTSGVYP